MRERQPGIRVGEDIDQVREDRARDVTLDEVLLVAAQVSALPIRLRVRQNARVEDDEVVTTEVIGEPLGRNDGGGKGWSRHVHNASEGCDDSPVCPATSRNERRVTR